MKKKFWQKLRNYPSKGGLIGALIGVFASVYYHRNNAKPYINAGKTALLSGFGYLAGEWFQRLLSGRSRNIPQS